MKCLVALLLGAGLLLPAAPALAGGRLTDGSASRRAELEALAVLERAAHAGRTVDPRGTPTVATADVPPRQTSDLPAAVAALREQGWRVPDGLPDGFGLFDARLSAPHEREHVLHLAYSDGLWTTSLFVQRGALGSAPPDGFRQDEVGGRPVWVRSDAPERVVWSGGGAVWTLVSDAPADVVRDAVATLPRDRAERDGVLARLGRGLGRLASALSPFD